MRKVISQGLCLVAAAVTLFSGCATHAPDASTTTTASTTVGSATSAPTSASSNPTATAPTTTSTTAGPSTSSTAATGSVTKAWDWLVKGDCFFIQEIIAGKSDLTVVPCTQPHTSEVVGLISALGDGTFSDTYLESQGNEYCPQLFNRYTGLEPTADLWLRWGQIKPNKASWDAGITTIVCFARTADDSEITESVQAS